MARLTKISPYRTGAPRFGTKGHVDKWDNSVKVSYLSPEELEEYRSGRKGGRRMVTHDDYLALEKQGLTKKEIAKKLDISVPTLYKRLEVWKQQPLKTIDETSQEAEIQKEKPSEGESEQKGKSGELVALIAELRAEKDDSDLRIQELEKLLNESRAEVKLFTKNQIAVSDQENIQLKEELHLTQKHVEEPKCELQEKEEYMQEVLGANENLHKEILVMNNSVIRSTELLNGASDEIENVSKKYNDLLREVEPLRQLALMKLQQDVGA